MRTGGGLAYHVLPSRCLDISLATVGDVPISWQSPNGDVHPAYYDPSGLEWLRTAAGGLLMTCGFTQAGAPNVDEGVELGLHGRAHHTPATQVAAQGRWVGDEYEMIVSGTVEESVIFGDHIRLIREIRSRLGSNTLDDPRSFRKRRLPARSAHAALPLQLRLPVAHARVHLFLPVAPCRATRGRYAYEGPRWLAAAGPRSRRACLSALGSGDGRRTAGRTRRSTTRTSRLVSGPATRPSPPRSRGTHPHCRSLSSGACLARAHMYWESSRRTAMCAAAAASRADGSLYIIEPGESRDFTLRLGH